MKDKVLGSGGSKRLSRTRVKTRKNNVLERRKNMKLRTITKTRKKSCKLKQEEG